MLHGTLTYVSDRIGDLQKSLAGADCGRVKHVYGRET